MDAELRTIPGAVVDERGLQHSGSPLTEQRALAEGGALAILDDRAVIAVGGPDRLTWLDSITSQALARLEPGVSTELLVLDPQGHVEHAAGVLDDGETAWLLVDRDRAAGLLAWLLKMRFRLRVEPWDASAEYAVVGGTPDALAGVAVASPAGTPLLWRDPWPGVSDGGVGYADDADHPGSARHWAEAVVACAERSRLIAEAAAGERAIAGLLAVDALRIAAWRPSAAELDERSIPHELDWLRTAVHLDKGCYRGQETVAKVHNLGHPPRRLVALQLDGSDSVLPAPGAEVRVGDDVIGTVRAAAVHYEDGPIALAVVRRAAPVDVDYVVDTADGPVAASPRVVVPAEAGAAASVPRLPRLNRRPPAS
ncbi:folate-binding protein [Microbacterium sp. X-17]|uniref:CAF17-like 4Fe-4S cluster assembly/insertion protein YgfZ n=1 Tax=Microbacterium sp. X-17 TaxID=3144404 RepID=UPI0031F4C21D